MFWEHHGKNASGGTQGRSAVVRGGHWQVLGKFSPDVIAEGVEATKEEAMKKAEAALLADCGGDWQQSGHDIRLNRGHLFATVTNLVGDGYMWKATRWGIVDTEADAKKQAEAALDLQATVDADSIRLVEAVKEIKQLRALLSESLAITRDSLESNKISYDEPDCECEACKRFRSIIARIEAVLR